MGPPPVLLAITTGTVSPEYDSNFVLPFLMYNATLEKFKKVLCGSQCAMVMKNFYLMMSCKVNNKVSSYP